MRLASYNVENLFERARALNLDTWAEGRKVLEAFAELNRLFEEAVYSPEIKARMMEMLKALGIDKRHDNKFLTLRENRGKLASYSNMWGAKITANGRADWAGWLELKTEIVNERSTQNSAQVVRDVAPDVLGFIEVENRRALTQFSGSLLPSVGGQPYDQIMLIDGNDDRGIDVGIMARNGYRIGWMRSHADDLDSRSRRVFSRDCPEYSIWTPSGSVVWVLINHFKSKGYGDPETSNARRYTQAHAVRLIYERLRSEGAVNIAVIGDFNDTPESYALSPLMTETDLKDASVHPTFQSDGHLGTYGRGTAKEKFDYLLLSPALFERVTGGAVFRKGVWGPNKVPPWDVYPDMRSSYDAGSDHAAIWCDIDI
jgi:endonuclease/exonuclease/phosphatase family metal-dependent hydrolase